MMDLLWRILLLAAACAATAAAAADGTKVRAALGDNVTLSCSFSGSVIRWYMEIHQSFRVCIVLVMDEDKDNRDLCVYNLEWKYVTRGNNLSIVGVTEDDYRRYFCARRKDGQMSFVDTFQVVSDEPVQAQTPTSDSGLQLQPPGTIWTTEPVLLVSLVLNVFFIVTILGLASVVVKRKKSCCWNSSASPRENPEAPDAPYEMITHPSHSPPTSAPPAECIYSKVQLSQPIPPRS